MKKVVMDIILARGDLDHKTIIDRRVEKVLFSQKKKKKKKGGFGGHE